LHRNDANYGPPVFRGLTRPLRSRLEPYITTGYPSANVRRGYPSASVRRGYPNASVRRGYPNASVRRYPSASAALDRRGR
jgi:hypothetical protein